MAMFSHDPVLVNWGVGFGIMPEEIGGHDDLHVAFVIGLVLAWCEKVWM